MNNTKHVNAKQAKLIYTYKNTKVKLHKTSYAWVAFCTNERTPDDDYILVETYVGVCTVFLTF
jgi:hypothetical protein